MDKACVETVRLLLQTAPEVLCAPSFALKGGTAINLFLQEMPRLSVDIDVVFTDHKAARPDALERISSELADARQRLAARGIDAELVPAEAGEEAKLFARRGRSLVKVEVNHVFRGTLLPVETSRLVKAARDLFTVELSVPVLALSELYGSKLVAALDRQHPRDFYDIREMYRTCGLRVEIVDCFVAYLAGHNRPIHEVLFSRDQDMQPTFDNEFQGLTREPTTASELIGIRERFRSDLASLLTEPQKAFLLSMAEGEPQWPLLRFPHLAELPALRWKLHNLAKLRKSNPRKFGRQAEELRRRFARQP